MSTAKVWRSFWADKTTPLYGDNSEDLFATHARELQLLYHPLQPASVLEVGCGNGAFYRHMGYEATRYRGVDFSPSMLDVFRKRYPGVDVACADGSTYRDHERYDLIISNQVVQNFDRTMLRRYLANARGMMHSKSVLVHAAVPWKQRRRAFYTGACLAGTRRRRVKGALVMLKARVTPDALGYWYDLSDFEALARETGMAVTFFGCMAYLYRFHVVMSLAEARE